MNAVERWVDTSFVDVHYNGKLYVVHTAYPQDRNVSQVISDGTHLYEPLQGVGKTLREAAENFVKEAQEFIPEYLGTFKENDKKATLLLAKLNHLNEEVPHSLEEALKKYPGVHLKKGYDTADGEAVVTWETPAVTEGPKQHAFWRSAFIATLAREVHLEVSRTNNTNHGVRTLPIWRELLDQCNNFPEERSLGSEFPPRLYG